MVRSLWAAGSVLFVGMSLCRLQDIVPAFSLEPVHLGRSYRSSQKLGDVPELLRGEPGRLTIQGEGIQ